ncbi:MAG: hypothetical protein WKG07_02735 [Hymenobacter sp.]
MKQTLRALAPCSAAALLILLYPAAGRAQQGPVKPVEIKFGKPEPADFEAKNFVGDSAAGAVVLYDYGNTRFRLNGLSFQLESERTTRIKILKKSGYDVATVEVPLYHQNQNEEKIVSLKGFTYNEVGGVGGEGEAGNQQGLHRGAHQEREGAQVYPAQRARGRGD